MQNSPAQISPDTAAHVAAHHRTVLPVETLAYLAPQRGGLLVDGTVGLGGHSEAWLEASPETQVLGLDRDHTALALAEQRLARFGARFRAVQANFSDLPQVAEAQGLTTAAAVLVDLGVSSWQLDSPERGFSFRYDAPLDMTEETAAQLLARLPEAEIARIIYEYGEERHSRRIARRIVARRVDGRPVATTRELAELVAGAVKSSRHDKIHPATRTFQALRIAVNRELESLERFIPAALALLEPGGRFLALSFHSLEDRIVKRFMRRWAGQCECPPRFPVCVCGAQRRVEILTRRPVTPTEAECQANPRARSAKLRACVKI
jgi:16S rRNA (cytosine1402-N4)-methyltransferase